MNNDRNPLFTEADRIFAYSREQALADGVLVDVSERAREAGFRYPVAVTAALWAAIQTIPDRVSWQDVSGRLWDVLTLGRHAVRQSARGGSELLYSLEMPVGARNTLTVKLVCGPGDSAEPVLTLMLPQED